MIRFAALLSLACLFGLSACASDGDVMTSGETTLVFMLDADERVLHAGKEVGTEGAAAIVMRHVEQGATVYVQIASHESVNVETLLKLLGAVRAAEPAEVSLVQGG